MLPSVYGYLLACCAPTNNASCHATYTCKYTCERCWLVFAVAANFASGRYTNLTNLIFLLLTSNRFFQKISIDRLYFPIFLMEIINRLKCSHGSCTPCFWCSMLLPYSRNLCFTIVETFMKIYGFTVLSFFQSVLPAFIHSPYLMLLSFLKN